MGIERVHGELAPRVLTGRLPRAGTRWRSGTSTARDLDVGVGDRVTFARIHG